MGVLLRQNESGKGLARELPENMWNMEFGTKCWTIEVQINKDILTVQCWLVLEQTGQHACPVPNVNLGLLLHYPRARSNVSPQYWEIQPWAQWDLIQICTNFSGGIPSTMDQCKLSGNGVWICTSAWSQPHLLPTAAHPHSHLPALPIPHLTPALDKLGQCNVPCTWAHGSRRRAAQVLCTCLSPGRVEQKCFSALLRHPWADSRDLYQPKGH